ncbi:MAG: helix-turn-helix domain-containing protein [Acidimicrobiales bacterium]
MSDSNIADLGAILRARRREKHLSLRDLSAEIDVSVNTLSRVERGHVPDLRNFRRIVDWLEVPAERFLESAREASTTETIARHLRADRRLPEKAAVQIAEIVEEMYHRLIGEQPAVTLHLRSAKTFTPRAGALLAEILTDMQASLQASPGD